MSTAAVSTDSVAPAKLASDRLIGERIEEACRALWWAELIRESLRTLIVALLATVLWVIVDQWLFSPSVSVRLLACLALASWCGWKIVTRIAPLLGSSIQPAYAARSLERDMPEMKQALTSYVTLRDEQQQPGLRSRVVRSIGTRVAGRLKTHDALPVEATGTMKWWLVAAGLLALFVIYAALSPKNTLVSVGRLVAPLASIDPAKRVTISEVSPADTEAIAGRAVDVSALVNGLREQEQVYCRWHTAAGVQETQLQYDEAELRFAGSIGLDHAVMGKLAYFIEAGDAKAGPYWLHVQNVPVVALQSVRYEPPPYTGEIAHTSSSGAITAVDGTKVTIRAGTNRPIEKATIEFNPRLRGKTVRATAGMKSLDIDEPGTGLSITFPLRSAHGRSAAVQLESYRIRVWDAAQQTNPDPIVYPIRVIADLPPEVSIVMPRKTPKNLPIDGQQIIEVHAMDPDFGLKQLNLEVRKGIDVVADSSLWSDPAGVKGNRVSEYRFRPTEHGLRVGDKVKIIAVATDNRYVPDDPSIEPNISRTDPIELRIVESQQLPDQPEGNDGLSKPDDRPASDDKQQQKSQPESGQGDQQGGSGGGEGTSETGDGSGQGGQPGENSKSGDSSQSGEPQDQSGAGGQSDSTAGEQSSQDGQGSKGDAGSEAGTNNDSQGQAPADSSGQGDNQKQQGSDSASEPTGSESPGADPSDGAGEGKTGEGSDASGQQDAASQPGSDAGTDQTSQGGPSDSAADAPPKHDGEAFERIRDYLEEKKQEQAEGDDQSGQQQPQGQQGDGQGQQQRQDGQQTDESAAGREQADRGDSGDQQSRGSKDDQSTGEPSETDAGKGDPAESTEQGQDRSDQSEQGSKAGEDARQQPGGDQSPTAQKPDGSEMKTGDSEGTEGDTDSRTKDGERDDQSGDAASDDATAGSDRESQPGKETPSEGDRGTEKPDKGQQGSSEQAEGREDSGDSAAQQSEPRESSGEGEKTDPSEASDQESAAGKQGSPESASEGSESRSKPESQKRPETDPSAAKQPQSTGDPTKSSSQPPTGSQQQASGDGSGTDDAGDQAQPPPPAEPDLEYTKRATDMVLDYLKETRDQPDSELLEELNWSEEDLQRFADRWQKVRELEKSGLPEGETSQDVEDALRSLGMRPQAGDSALQNQDKADSLRGIRDAGNRRPPPAAYRDVFDAFRRAIGRQ